MLSSVEVNFYAIEHNLYGVLANLLNKSLEINKNCYVVFKNKELAESCDNDLWKFPQWLPHCLFENENESITPITIAYLNNTKINVKNNALYLFIMEDALEDFKTTDSLSVFERIFIIFDTSNSVAVEINRDRWINLKKANVVLKYYKQLQNGKFVDNVQ